MRTEVVFDTTDRFELARAESALDDANIIYMVKNDRIQSLFPSGLGLGGYSLSHSFQIAVSHKEAARARHILDRLFEGEDTGLDDDAS